MHFSRRKTLNIILGLIIATALRQVTGSIETQARRVLIIATITLVFWVTEVMPLYVTGLLMSFLLIVLAGFTPEQIFPQYLNPTITLFLGGLVIARTMEKYSLDTKIAYNTIQILGSTPSKIVLGCMFITAFLSMWISNTASVALMIPLGLKILASNRVDKYHANFSKVLILGIAYASTIGGMATLVGTPPNAIAASYIQDTGFGFMDWLLHAAPFAIGLIFIARAVLTKIFPIRVKKVFLNKNISYIRNTQDYIIIGVLVLTAFLWLIGDMIGLASSVVAIVPIVLLALLGYFQRDDIKQISRPVILLLGSGIVLGYAIINSGLDQYVLELIQTIIPSISAILVIPLIAIVSILFTMFVSNVASAAVLIPLMFPLANLVNIPPEILILTIGLAVSCDFTMPMGNSSNAMAYGSNVVGIVDMAKSGLIISIFAIILLTVFALFIRPIL